MAFTCAAVYAGLMAGSTCTEGSGKAGLTGTYRRAAAEVKAGMDRYLYRQELNRFARMVTFKKNGTLDNVDPTIDASLYAVGCFGVYDPAEERVTRTDRKSTRLNSSHSQISYAVFCLKKKKQN